jgi:hypothetical protein
MIGAYSIPRRIVPHLCAVPMCLLLSGAASKPSLETARTSETVTEALCRLIDNSARNQRLPAAFLTRLIWRESSFRLSAVSPAGAQGVAQFMPGTANERGLADPFDPEQAIPEAARFLSDLQTRFGNLGLAAAAYNGGPGRVSAWLAGKGELRQETRDYVAFITGRAVDDWAVDANVKRDRAASHDFSSPQNCLQATAFLRRPGTTIAESPVAPWGVQLAGNFSKEQALASFSRARQSYAAVIGDLRPMVIGTRLRSRGTRAFYRVRLPQPTQRSATQLCDRIRAQGGACVVLPS